MLWQYRGTAGTFLISLIISRDKNLQWFVKIQIANRIKEAWFWDIVADFPFFGSSPINWLAVPEAFAAVGSTFGKIPLKIIDKLN